MGVVVFAGCSMNGDNGEPWPLLRDYAIGDPGPAGGTVFYDKGERTDGWRYLEAWVEDVAPGAQWSATSDSIGVTSAFIGAGKENTRQIVAFYGGSGYAAAAVSDLVTGEFDDWFLPSRDELQELYTQSAAVVGVFTGIYWSSTEVDANDVSVVSFIDGSITPDAKTLAYNTRPVRRF